MASHVINGLLASNAPLPDAAIGVYAGLPASQWTLGLITIGPMTMATQNGAEVIGGALYLTPNDDFVYTATLTDDADEAYSLNGCTLWFTIKRRYSDTDDNAMAKAYWVSGGASANMTVTSPVDGEFTVRFTPAVTVLFTRRSYVWDLQAKDTDGIISTVAQGVVAVLPGVTTRTTTP